MEKQIEKILPRSAWDNMAIQENGEPLVEVQETEKLKIGLVSKSYKPSFFVRKTIKKQCVYGSVEL